MFMAITKLVLKTKREQQARQQQTATESVRLGKSQSGNKSNDKKGCCWNRELWCCKDRTMVLWLEEH